MRPKERHGPLAGKTRPRDRLAVSRDAIWGGLFRQGRHPPLPTRLMAGLAILKSTHDLSDEELCARWVENPYFQLFFGEEFF
jgi:hypothetical protein